jgi:hypothetical protein
MKKIIFLTASLAIALESSGGLFDPSNYEDCVLDGVKDAKNEAAVGAVYQMCRRKFPPKTQKNELNIKGRLVCETLNHNNKTIITYSYDLLGRKAIINGYSMSIREVSDKKIYSVGKDGDSIMYTFDNEILTIQNKNVSVDLQCSNSR